MELYLFRHGIAEDGFGKPDFERVLTPEGRLKLRRQVVGLKRMDLEVDTLLSSPYKRTQETAKILANGLDLKMETLPDLGCGASLDDVVEYFESNGQPNSAMLVGHQPDLGEMVRVLTGQDVKVKKGTLIHIHVKRFGFLGGELKAVVQPEEQIAF
jgi:phosphohistidine phosphatase